MDDEEFSYVYMLVNPINQIPFYVGITNSPDLRFEDHLESKEGKKRAEIVSNIKSNGFIPLMVILERKIDRKSARRSEIFWIELLSARGVPIVNKEILNGIECVAFHTSGIREQSIRKKVASHESTNKAADPSIGKPENHGKSWEGEEVKALQASFILGVTLDELSVAHKRTRAGILGQLTKISRGNKKVYLRMAELNLLPSQEAYRQFQS